VTNVKLLCLAVSSPRSRVNERRRDTGAYDVPAQRYAIENIFLDVRAACPYDPAVIET
jgi:hypothetical protein